MTVDLLFNCKLIHLVIALIGMFGRVYLGVIECVLSSPVMSFKTSSNWSSSSSATHGKRVTNLPSAAQLCNDGQ